MVNDQKNYQTKIKETRDIVKCDDDNNISIHTNDKLQDHIFLKNIVILITCIIKDDGKFYPQLI